MDKKKLIAGVIAVLLFALGTSAFFYLRNSGVKLPWQPTPQGIFFEELLPPDVFFAMNFNPTDDAQRQSFEKLWTAVLQDKKDIILPFIATDLAKSNQAPLPLADLLTLFGRNLQFTLAMSNDSSIKKPDIFFLFLAEDPSAVRGIFQRIKQPDDQPLRDTSDAFAFSRGKAAQAHIGLVGDIGFFALTTKEKTEQFITRFERRNSFRRMASFATSKEFRSAAKFLSNPMSGYLFLSPKETGKNIQTSIVIYSAQEDGFALNGMMFPAEGQAGDVLRQKIFQPFAPSLASKIPLSKGLIYKEVGYAGSFLLSQFGSFAADFQKWTGFNFETDILPFLDKDLVFSIEDTGGILPALSLWMDVSAPGAQEKAKAALEKFDAKVKSWITLGSIALASSEAEQQDKPVFDMQQLAAPLSGSKVVLCFDCINYKTINAPLLFELLSDPLEISYGMTADNILFFSTLPNLEKTFSETAKAENNQLFKRAQSMEPKPGNVIFIDAEAIGVYIERLVNFARFNKKFSESEEQSYALLKKYLSPIKSYIQSGQGDGKRMQMSAFLEIRSGTSTQP